MVFGQGRGGGGFSACSGLDKVDIKRNRQEDGGGVGGECVRVGASNEAGRTLQKAEHWVALALQSSEPGLSVADSSSLI